MFINERNTSPSDVLSSMFVFIIQSVQTVGYFTFIFFVFLRVLSATNSNRGLCLIMIHVMDSDNVT